MEGCALVPGDLAVVGYGPDGDSIRFVPADPAALDGLAGGDAVVPDPQDGSVQLRLDAVDAPERAYRGRAQPLAEPARGALLELVGFTDVAFGEDGAVAASAPQRVPAVVATAVADDYGRVVAVLFAGSGGPDGALDAAAAQESVNAALLRSGRAYPTLYGTTPTPVREAFAEVARGAAAHPAPGSVWEADRSTGFVLRTRDDVGPDGQLVLPKLFRRATDWFDAGAPGTLPGWLRDGGAEDDRVLLAGRETTLSDLLEVDGDVVRLLVPPVGLADLVFLEPVRPGGSVRRG